MSDNVELIESNLNNNFVSMTTHDQIVNIHKNSNAELLHSAYIFMAEKHRQVQRMIEDHRTAIATVLDKL